MEQGSTKALSSVIRSDDEQIREPLGEIVRGRVDETLNALSGAEAGWSGPAVLNGPKRGVTAVPGATIAGCGRGPVRSR